MGVAESTFKAVETFDLLANLSNQQFEMVITELDSLMKNFELQVTKWQLFEIFPLKPFEVKRIMQLIAKTEHPDKVPIHQLLCAVILARKDLKAAEKVRKLMLLICFNLEPNIVHKSEIEYIFVLFYRMIELVTEFKTDTSQLWQDTSDRFFKTKGRDLVNVIDIATFVGQHPQLEVACAIFTRQNKAKERLEEINKKILKEASAVYQAQQNALAAEQAELLRKKGSPNKRPKAPNSPHANEQNTNGSQMGEGGKGTQGESTMGTITPVDLASQNQSKAIMSPKSVLSGKSQQKNQTSSLTTPINAAEKTQNKDENQQEGDQNDILTPKSVVYSEKLPPNKRQLLWNAQILSLLKNDLAGSDNDTLAEKQAKIAATIGPHLQYDTQTLALMQEKLELLREQSAWETDEIHFGSLVEMQGRLNALQQSNMELYGVRQLQFMMKGIFFEQELVNNPTSFEKIIRGGQPSLPRRDSLLKLQAGDQTEQFVDVIRKAQLSQSFKLYFKQNLSELKYELKMHHVRLISQLNVRGERRIFEKKKYKYLGEINSLQRILNEIKRKHVEDKMEFPTQESSGAAQNKSPDIQNSGEKMTDQLTFVSMVTQKENEITLGRMVTSPQKSDKVPDSERGRLKGMPDVNDILRMIYKEIENLKSVGMTKKELMQFINTKDQKSQSKKSVSFWEGVIGTLQFGNQVQQFEEMPQYSEFLFLAQRNLRSEERFLANVLQERNQMKENQLEYFTQVGKLKGLQFVLDFYERCETGQDMFVLVQERITKLFLRLEKIDVNLLGLLQPHISRKRSQNLYFKALGKISAYQCITKGLQAEHSVNYLIRGLFKIRLHEILSFVANQKQDLDGKSVTNIDLQGAFFCVKKVSEIDNNFNLDVASQDSQINYEKFQDDLQSMAEEERINAEAPKVMLMPTDEDQLDAEMDQELLNDTNIALNGQGGGQIMIDTVDDSKSTEKTPKKVQPVSQPHDLINTRAFVETPDSSKNKKKTPYANKKSSLNNLSTLLQSVQQDQESLTTNNSKVTSLHKKLTRILRSFYRRHRADITLNKQLDTFFRTHAKQIAKVQLQDSVKFRNVDIEEVGLKLLDFVEIEDNFNQLDPNTADDTVKHFSQMSQSYLGLNYKEAINQITEDTSEAHTQCNEMILKMQEFSESKYQRQFRAARIKYVSKFVECLKQANRAHYFNNFDMHLLSMPLEFSPKMNFQSLLTVSNLISFCEKEEFFKLLVAIDSEKLKQATEHHLLRERSGLRQTLACLKTGQLKVLNTKPSKETQELFGTDTDILEKNEQTCQLEDFKRLIEASKSEVHGMQRNMDEFLTELQEGFATQAEFEQAANSIDQSMLDQASNEATDIDHMRDLIRISANKIDMEELIKAKISEHMRQRILKHDKMKVLALYKSVLGSIAFLDQFIQKMPIDQTAVEEAKQGLITIGAMRKFREQLVKIGETLDYRPMGERQSQPKQAPKLIKGMSALSNSLKKSLKNISTTFEELLKSEFDQIETQIVMIEQQIRDLMSKTHHMTEVTHFVERFSTLKQFEQALETRVEQRSIKLEQKRHVIAFLDKNKPKTNRQEEFLMRHVNEIGSRAILNLLSGRFISNDFAYLPADYLNSAQIQALNRLTAESDQQLNDNTYRSPQVKRKQSQLLSSSFKKKTNQVNGQQEQKSAQKLIQTQKVKTNQPSTQNQASTGLKESPQVGFNSDGEQITLLPIGESEISANYVLHFLNHLVELDDRFSSKLILKFDSMFNFIQLQRCEQDLLISKYNMYEALNLGLKNLVNVFEVHSSPLELYLRNYEKVCRYIEKTLVQTIVSTDESHLKFFFFDIMSQKGSALFKKSMNKYDQFMALAQMDDEDKTNFSMVQAEIKKRLDHNIRYFKEFIDLEENRKVALDHAKTIEQQDQRLMQEVASLILLVRKYYLKQSVAREW